jgi:ribosomal protein S27E
MEAWTGSPYSGLLDKPSRFGYSKSMKELPIDIFWRIVCKDCGKVRVTARRMLPPVQCTRCKGVHVLVEDVEE